MNLILLIISFTFFVSNVKAQNCFYYHFVIDSTISFNTGDIIVMPTCHTESDDNNNVEENNFICEVDMMIELLEKHPQDNIEIAVHTDCRGDNNFNVSYSQNTADKYRDFIITYGIDANRVLAKGYGATNPRKIDRLINMSCPYLKVNQILDCDFIEKLENIEEKELAHSLNRRVEIRIL